MDAFEIDNNVLNPHNSNSTPTFHCLPKIKLLFRTIEILAILIFLTSASTRLPFALKLTGEYFRRLITFVVSPLFIFLLSNGIALTLYVKSRHHFSEHSQTALETHLEFHHELVRNGTNYFASETCFQPEEVVFQDKQTIVEVTKVTKDDSRRDSSEELRKVLEGDNRDGCGKQRRRVADGGEVDELSNEEFQRAVEEFIAKQIKFHREEEVDINVLHGFA